MTLPDLAIAALASFRTTRLVVLDDITARPRDALHAWLIEHEHPKLLELASCSYCVGVWVSLVVLVARRRLGRPGAALVALLAVSGAQALLSAVDDRLSAKPPIPPPAAHTAPRWRFTWPAAARHPRA